MESRPAEQRRTLLRLELLEVDVTVTFCGCQECCDPHSWPLCFTLLCLLSHHFLAISLDLTLCLGLLLASDPSAENLFLLVFLSRDSRKRIWLVMRSCLCQATWS